MLARFRSRKPSHSTVAAYAALFIALSGTAYAAVSIGPGQIKNDAVRSRHIDNGAVGNADLGAKSVATGEVRNGTLLRRDFRSGQLPPAMPPLEVVQLVKEPSGVSNCPASSGEFCAFDFGGVPVAWTNYGDGYTPAGFYKDRSGIVHLQGSVKGPEVADLFVLPQGYRPSEARWFLVWNGSSASHAGGLAIRPDGTVDPQLPDNSSYLSLDGIQFRP